MPWPASAGDLLTEAQGNDLMLFSLMYRLAEALAQGVEWIGVR
jgi:hypothetical protein